MDKGTRVRVKDTNSTSLLVQEYLLPGNEGIVTSSHTNGMIYVQMDAMPNVGSWSYSESELELV